MNHYDIVTFTDEEIKTDWRLAKVRDEYEAEPGKWFRYIDSDWTTHYIPAELIERKERNILRRMALEQILNEAGLSTTLQHPHDETAPAAD